MERKIGEIFESDGEWYQCVVAMQGCRECFFRTRGYCTRHSECMSTERSDKTSVIFKELKKVGKPFYRRWTLEGNNKLMQRYKIYTTPLITIDKQKMFYNLTDDLLEIEIKIKQEDMEEKGQCCDNRFEIINKAKEALLKETNIARDGQEMAVIDNILFRCWQMGWLDKYDDTKHSNSENIGKSLKPFNLEAAKAGKPVCTRDGRKARIICWDRKDIKPIVALVTIMNDTSVTEKAFYYFEDGRYLSKNDNNDGDLMMLPEKKEGWINVYALNTCYSSKADAEAHIDGDYEHDYVRTVKIEWEE